MDTKYKVMTGKSYEEALEELWKNLKKRGFGDLLELDFEGNMKVLEACNPKQVNLVDGRVNLNCAYY